MLSSSRKEQTESSRSTFLYSPFSREELYDLMLENNIETRPLWKPMHLQPIFKEAPYYGSKVSEALFKIGLCLPSGSNLQEAGLKRIESVISKLKEV